MKTSDILELDYRLDENKKVIQKVLKQIKPLSKYSDEDVPIDAIEKVIKTICQKYQVRIRNIIQDIWSNKKYNIWKCDIMIDGHIYDTLGTVYGMSIYELFAKIAILMYSEIKKERLKVRE